MKKKGISCNGQNLAPKAKNHINQTGRRCHSKPARHTSHRQDLEKEILDGRRSNRPALQRQTGTAHITPARSREGDLGRPALQPARAPTADRHGAHYTGKISRRRSEPTCRHGGPARRASRRQDLGSGIRAGRRSHDLTPGRDARLLAPLLGPTPGGDARLLTPILGPTPGGDARLLTQLLGPTPGRDARLLIQLLGPTPGGDARLLTPLLGPAPADWRDSKLQSWAQPLEGMRDS